MQRSNSRQATKPGNLFILSIILWFSTSMCFASQTSTPDNFSTSPIAIAKALMRQLCPKLADKGYIAEIELSAPFDMPWASTPEFNFVISRRRAWFEKPSPTPLGKQAVVKNESVPRALFGFDSKGIIQDMYVHSAEVVLDSKQEEVRKLVNSHREWSEVQVEAALKKAGAKYGPSNQNIFSSPLPRKELEPFIGSFNVDSAEFRQRHQQPSGSLAELYWEVNVSSKMADGRLLHGSLTFEPFGGNRTSISRYLKDL